VLPLDTLSPRSAGVLMYPSGKFRGGDWCLDKRFSLKACEANAIGIHIVLLAGDVLPLAIFADYFPGGRQRLFTAHGISPKRESEGI